MTIWKRIYIFLLHHFHPLLTFLEPMFRVIHCAHCTLDVWFAPQSAAAYTQRGAARYQREDHVGALTDYNHALRIDERYAPAYINRGLLYLHYGGINDAIIEFNQAIYYDANQPAAYNNRALANRARGNLVAALNDYQVAIALAPFNPTVYNNRANVYIEMGHFDNALADLSTALALHPHHSAASYNYNLVWARLYPPANSTKPPATPYPRETTWLAFAHP